MRLTQAKIQLKQHFEWWLGDISQDVLRYVSICMECQESRPIVVKTVSIWPEAEVWEKLYMDWGYIEDQGNILVIVDAGSCLIEAFPAGKRTSQTVKVHLNQIFARFGMPRILVSDNGPEFASSNLKQWCESLEIKKMESPIYHPRANGFAERAVQTMKRSIQAWSTNLNASFGAFLQRALMKNRNTSKTRGKTPLNCYGDAKYDFQQSLILIWSKWTSPLQADEQFTNGSSYFRYP